MRGVFKYQTPGPQGPPSSRNPGAPQMFEILTEVCVILTQMIFDLIFLRICDISNDAWFGWADLLLVGLRSIGLT